MNTFSTAKNIISAIENQSVLVYSVLFTVIGIRLDASQLIQTLLASPVTAFTLFLFRLVGLVVGAAGGGFLVKTYSSSEEDDQQNNNNSEKTTHFLRWRGLALVTRIAVSIILLQKMEDALPEAKHIVHSAIGAVIFDMIAGPPLLQMALKNVEAAAAAAATDDK